MCTHSFLIRTPSHSLENECRRRRGLASHSVKLRAGSNSVTFTINSSNLSYGLSTSPQYTHTSSLISCRVVDNFGWVEWHLGFQGSTGSLSGLEKLAELLIELYCTVNGLCTTPSCGSISLDGSQPDNTIPNTSCSFALASTSILPRIENLALLPSSLHLRRLLVLKDGASSCCRCSCLRSAPNIA